ncbi:DUF4253 domain-containing protein [Spirillospora sp. NPDC029432]|uniref:DUF4253 domain-containing protein n=1 Tax=Spirillospora sp. NPDC029432 TaxID=3154599 RepID=UPI0034519A2A
MARGSALDELPQGLPPGRLVAPDPDYFDDPTWSRDVLWVSDGSVPDAAARWLRLYEARAETGLHPLLLDTLDGEPERPWRAGELSPAPVGTIDVLSADGVLRRFWDDVALPEDGDWPGLAEAGESARDADDAARSLAESLAGDRDWSLGLVPAGRGADALALAGWDGPCNHTNHTQEISAVLRSWEDRFGARVVAVGFATLMVSVAAPPVTAEHAVRVAAEHFAFCPDNWVDHSTLEDYAETILKADHWSFWWD